MIRDFDDSEDWFDEGFTSCARWLSWRTGISPGAARERVRVARALGELPALSKALCRGKISYSAARALTRSCVIALTRKEWERGNPVATIDIDYEEEILTPLKYLKLSEIVDATGLSMSYAAAIRNGREVPHRRHWKPLLQLIERESDRIQAKKKLSRQWAETDFERDIRPGLQGLPVEEIAAAIQVPRPYAARIRRGARIPARKHWGRLRSWQPIRGRDEDDRGEDGL